MKYALLVYDAPDSWQDVATEQKRALHGQYHALASFPGVTGHYRLRSPRSTTTVRVVEDKTVTTEGRLADTSEHLRALYLLEGDDDSAIEFAARVPAARMGGAVEIWTLTER